MKKIIFYSKTILVIFFFSNSFNLSAQTATLKPTLTLEEINGVNIPFQNNIPLSSFEKQSRTTIDLSGTWKKYRFDANHDLSLAERTQQNLDALLTESGGKTLINYDDSGWEDKEIPSVENEMNPFPTVPEYYQNGVYYRYKFSVDDSLSEENAKLIFYSVNYVADVWLNENYLGYHEGGFTPFAFDVSNAISYDSENVLVVRVDNIQWGTRKDIIPFYRCDWFNYTGIIHDVYLEFSDKISVTRTDVVPQNIECDLEVNIITSNNSSNNANVTARLKIFDADINEFNIESENWDELKGSEIAFSGESEHLISLTSSETIAINTLLSIPNPKLWSPSDPNLYILQVNLFENENLIDSYHTQFGVRTIETDSNKVKLNGQVVFLTGGARHEDHPEYGRSIPKEIIYTDLKTVKEAKMNFLRTSHYPNHPYTYLMADRIGITVMEEIPVWWFDNEEEWLIQNNERHIHEQMFREMVFKDYNRPSIILWSTSNECKEVTNRLIYNERIVDDIKTNYPDNRLISQSSAADNPGFADTTQIPLDVAGWTMYFGIFHGSTYFNGTLVFLSRVRSAFIDKPVIDTEFGYWSSEDGSNMETQVNVFNDTFDAFEFFSPMKKDGALNKNGFLMGTTWWCVFDWYSHQHPNGFQSMGLISMDRQTKKPVYDALVDGYSPYFENGGLISLVDDGFIERELPNEFILYQNYPNPFNPSTSINFSIPQISLVKIDVYNGLGQKVKSLLNEVKNSGLHQIEFAGNELASGVYFCKVKVIQSGKNTEFVKTIKMLLIK